MRIRSLISFAVLCVWVLSQTMMAHAQHRIDYRSPADMVMASAVLAGHEIESLQVTKADPSGQHKPSLPETGPCKMACEAVNIGQVHRFVRPSSVLRQVGLADDAAMAIPFSLPTPPPDCLV